MARLNLDLNHGGSESDGLCEISETTENLIGRPAHQLFRATEGGRVVLAGDVCYEEALADQVVNWLRTLASQEDVTVLLGDPGRHACPTTSGALREVGRWELPRVLLCENYGMCETAVWKVEGWAAAGASFGDGHRGA